MVTRKLGGTVEKQMILAPSASSTVLRHQILFADQTEDVPSATPPAPKSTSSTCIAFTTINPSTFTPVAASRGVLAAVAPLLTAAARDGAYTSYALTGKPCFDKLYGRGRVQDG